MPKPDKDLPSMAVTQYWVQEVSLSSVAISPRERVGMYCDLIDLDFLQRSVRSTCMVKTNDYRKSCTTDFKAS